MPEYPKVNYPTILDGFVKGDKLRLESGDGSEMILSGERFNLLFFVQSGSKWGTGFTLKNFGPVQIDGKLWGVTHMQKHSTWGWLKVNPDCYHRWWFWKSQEQDAKGGWLPGTERGLYFRKPFSWRWDVTGTVIDGVLRHWIWTKGYLGGHWD